MSTPSHLCITDPRALHFPERRRDLKKADFLIVLFCFAEPAAKDLRPCPLSRCVRRSPCVQTITPNQPSATRHTQRASLSLRPSFARSCALFVSAEQREARTYAERRRPRPRRRPDAYHVWQFAKTEVAERRFFARDGRDTNQALAQRPWTAPGVDKALRPRPPLRTKMCAHVF